MIKKLQFKLVLLLCALVAGVSSAWADNLYYTLEPIAGSNNGYASNCDVTIDEISWNITGNAQMIPWRLGGKSLTGVNREVYSKTAMGSAISNIELTVGAASSITVNSLKLIVASDETFSSELDEVTAVFTPNSTISFVPTSSTAWAKDAYYKFVFNVTVTGTSNKFVEFTRAKFYAPEGSSSTVAKPTFNPAAGEVSKGTTVSLIQNDAALILYTLDGSTPSYTNSIGEIYSDPIVINTATTIKAIAVDSEDNESSVATASYTLIKVDPNLSFTTANYDVSMDNISSFVSQAVNNPNNVSVTYSVTPSSVASIDATTGTVTLTGAKGKATVSATFDGNEEYLASTVRYTINVYNPNEAVFDFASKTDDYGSGVSTTSDSNSYIEEEKVWTNGVITLITNGKYRWWNNDGTLRFYNNSPQSTIVVTAADGYALTDIAITGGQQFSSNDGTYSSTTGKWAGLAKNITLTYAANNSINVKTITVNYTRVEDVTVTSAGLATFASDYALDFTNVAGLEAYIAKEGDGEVAIELHKKEKVPAETGMLLRAKDSGTSFTVPVATGNSDDVTGNLFVRGTGATVASSEGENDNIYSNYILNVVNDELGFYKANGQTVAENRAYLHILGGGGNARLSIVFNDEAAGIAEIETMRTVENEKVYNLNGQRVSKATKGLYIINGKKVIRN